MKAIVVTNKMLQNALRKLEIQKEGALRMPENERAQKNFEKSKEEYEATLAPIAAAVENALSKVNGKASSFTIKSFSVVHDICVDLEEDLRGRGVTTKNMVGTVATFAPQGPSANSYKYRAIGTEITVKRVTDGWRLIDIKRVDIRPKQPECRDVVISQEAAEDIRRSAFEGLLVRAA